MQRGRMIALSWDGLRVPAIAEQLGCREQTVRRWLERFNACGLDGLADRGGQGRKRRITEHERSRTWLWCSKLHPAVLFATRTGGSRPPMRPDRRNGP
ncbi:helix-turn-helix domain-containing protein [Rhodococcus sp. NPDC056960]|uniref:helix-turn-helix domain-containing protein n=1 Tax=Rhodococcus TaxID=1827 RepID=UPI003638F364